MIMLTRIDINFDDKKLEAKELTRTPRFILHTWYLVLLYGPILKNIIFIRNKNKVLFNKTNQAL